jgi:hypothetical protein
MTKIWKIIKPSKYNSLGDIVKNLKKKKVFISPWIEDIIKNKKNKLTVSKNKVFLYRIKVRSLGFKKATELRKIYKKIKEKKFSLVTLDIALIARLHYRNQKIGEWLRFATPYNSLIDSDGIPHLPKLGKALKKFFIETYWSYPKAIFHPHNEFVVMKYDI